MIYGLRCTEVNPHLIAYKNSFLNISECFKNYEVEPCEGEVVMENFENYVAEMRLYVPRENDWLEAQQELMGSWRFKLIAPYYIKQAAEYQWKMYEGYRDDAKYMLETYDTNGGNEDIAANHAEARDRRLEYQQKYYDYIDEVSLKGDWRFRFTFLPFPEGCTQENLTIPETAGSIDWGAGSPEEAPVLFEPVEGPVS